MKLLMLIPKYDQSLRPNYCYVYPLGIGYITSVLKQAGHQVDCLNMNHGAGSAEDILQPVLAGSNAPYDFVLTGGTSIYYPQVKQIVDAVRRIGAGAGVILGGGLISSEPELMMAALKPDYIVTGEAEATVVELMECLRNNKPLTEVAGIGYTGGDGKLMLTKPRDPIRDLDTLPLPDFDSFEFAQVLDRMRVTDTILYYPFDFPRSYPLLASRSCPYMCTFCYHPVGNMYRQRSVDSIMKEIELNIPKYRINIISLHDELFSKDKKRVNEFCERFNDFRRHLEWECLWTCGMRIDDVDAELLKTMKKAGCFLIGYGFESFSAKILESMRKKTIPAQIERAVDLTLKANISVLGNFIFGDTAETPATAKTTLDYWKSNSVAAINLNFVIPFPGSEIYKRCVKKGVIRDKLAFIETGMIYEDVNCTATMTDSEFLKLKAEVFLARLKYNRLVYPRSQVIRSGDVCDMVIQCPFCKAVMEYKNCAVVRTYESYDLHCRQCSHHFFLVTRKGYWLCRLSVLILDCMPKWLRVMIFKALRAGRSKVSKGKY